MTKKKFLTLAIATAIAGISLVWVTTATSSYIHEKTVNWVNTISICDPDSNGTKCITMMDRNLWANIAWTGCSSIDTWACWYHYQWWNNHGFLSCNYNDCASFPWWETPLTDQRVSVYGSTYSGDVFRIVTSSPYTWSNSSINNLWWWGWDKSSNNWWYDTRNMVATNVTWRQWPCPTWYHVPSRWEWLALSGIWMKLSDVTWTIAYNPYFRDDFRIPLAGLRVYNGKVDKQGISVNLWSSSPDTSNKALCFHSATHSQSVIYGSSVYVTANGVRCFKNYALTFQTYVELTESTWFIATVWDEIYTELPDALEVSTEIEEESVGHKPVVWGVKVDFWEDVSAKFNKLVLVKIPVGDEEQVIVKVKHGWSSVYNFDWLTLNRNATCDANWRPTSSQYNWEKITVVDGFASIYTCEASSFVALWLWSWEAIWEVTLTLTAWENTCTLNDYNLWTHNVSSEDQNVSTSWQNMVCEFLKNPWATIQLSMWDLIDWTKTIWRQYFTWIVTSLWNPLWTIANLTWWSYNFLSSHVIYTKEANTIWTWTWSLAIEWIIPAWTPSWEYTWELNIIICEGC